MILLLVFVHLFSSVTIIYSGILCSGIFHHMVVVLKNHHYYNHYVASIYKNMHLISLFISTYPQLSQPPRKSDLLSYVPCKWMGFLKGVCPSPPCSVPSWLDSSLSFTYFQTTPFSVSSTWAGSKELYKANISFGHISLFRNESETL